MDFNEYRAKKKINEQKYLTEKDIKKYVTLFIISLLGLIILLNSVYIISSGESGVLLTMGKVSNTPLEAGLNFKLPFIQSLVRVDIKTMKYEADASASSKDLQVVTAKIVTNYRVEKSSIPNIVATIGQGYQDKVIMPMEQEIVKAITAKFTAEELITKREEVRTEMKELLRIRLLERGIIVEEVSITNFDFSAEFNKAIENKVMQEQNALASKNKLEQVKYEAEQKVVSAKAEAESLALQKAQVTQELIELRKIEVQRLLIEKWNGVMPTTLSGWDAMINVGGTQ